MKRTFDIAVSFFGLVILLPIMLCIALSIIILDGLPVLFKQRRVGRNGFEFDVVKFRTMSIERGAEFGRFDVGNLNRVTRIGKILRQLKLDELPQLWNVLIGEMSLVGPRPEVRKWVDAYPIEWAFIHTVRPGITDPASVFYRNEEDLLSASRDPETTYRMEVLPRKIEMYKQYIQKRSFLGDIFIILVTLKVLIFDTRKR